MDPIQLGRGFTIVKESDDAITITYTSEDESVAGKVSMDAPTWANVLSQLA